MNKNKAFAAILKALQASLDATEVGEDMIEVKFGKKTVYVNVA